MKNVVLLGSTGSIGTSTIKVAEDLPEVKDAGLWRKLPFALLLASLLLFGIMPRLLTTKIEPAVKEIVAMAKGELPKVLPVKRADAK